MKKKDLSPREAWEILTKEETQRKQTRARNALTLTLAYVCSFAAMAIAMFVTYFGTLAEQKIEQPVHEWLDAPFLWKGFQALYEKGSEPFASFMIALPFALVAVLIVSVLVTLVVRGLAHMVFLGIKPAKTKLPEDTVEAWQTVIQKAEKLNVHKEPSKARRWIVTVLVFLLVLAIGGYAAYLGEQNDLDVNIYMAMFEMAPLYWIGYRLIASLVRKIACVSYAKADVGEIAGAAKKAHKEENKRREEVRKEAELSVAISEGATLFFEQKYAEARTRVSKFSNELSGDIVAIMLLTDDKVGKTISGLRKSFDRLWKAKDLGFRNNELRKAVDYALNEVTPLVMEQAQVDMLVVYKLFIDGEYNAIPAKCKPHVAYGHPEAIVLDIVSRIQSESGNDHDKYPDWLRLMKLAVHRGVPETVDCIVDEVIDKLEDTIRYNEDLEKRRAAEAKRRREAASSSYSYNYGYGGGLPTWAEPSGWTDFRTGETLYRVNGQIVNANGEEVSAAWWE